MEISNSNLPAFPPNAGWEHAEAKGLTKREYFAAMAMQGFAANSHESMFRSNNYDLAKFSVQLADALIAELEK